MKEHKSVSALFYISGAYDGILGVAFLFFSTAIYQSQQVPPPNHIGYIQFPAAILIIFALMFFAVAANPVRNRNLIPYGMLLKVAYCAVVFGHWFSHGLPNMWKPFAIIDIAFLLLFWWAWARTCPAESA